MLPPNYDDDLFIQRYNQDKIINSHGTSLLNMCISSGLRILNGRYIVDSIGYHTCFTANGCSNVDYGIVSKCLLPSVKYFCTKDPNYLSDHVQIYFVLSCNINSSYNICKNNSILKKGFKYKWRQQSQKKKWIIFYHLKNL